MAANHHPPANTPSQSLHSSEKQLMEARMSGLDFEIAGIKEDVGSVKRDVGIVQMELRSIANTQGIMQTAQRDGITEIKEMMRSQSESPPKFGMGLIGGFISILATGVLALWATINLLVSPISRGLENHTNEGHPDTQKAIALLLERSELDRERFDKAYSVLELHARDRHKQQQEEIETLYRLEEADVHRAIAAAKAEGEFETMDKWLRDDTAAVKADVDQLREEVMPAIELVRLLQGRIEDLTQRVRDTDNLNRTNPIKSP